MVDHIFAYLSFFKKSILRIDWNSLNLIKNLEIPVFFISGRNDQIVPCSHMDRLYEAASKASYKDMFKVDNGTHNETWFQAGDDYWYKIKDFIDYEFIKNKHNKQFE
jgi:hypothetical protein